MTAFLNNVKKLETLVDLIEGGWVRLEVWCTAPTLNATVFPLSASGCSSVSAQALLVGEWCREKENF